LEIGVAWLGHSTVALELGDARVLTDPVLRNRVAHLVRPEGDWYSRYTSPDVVLISHGHRDHLDMPSLELISRDARVILPRGLGKAVGKLGFKDIVEVEEGDDVNVGLHVRVTHAEHNGHAVGYLLGGVYFAGDTDLFPEMASLHSEVALLPVGGWGPRVPAGHLDPARAARALVMLQPRLAIPIHWGTFRPIYKRELYRPDAGREFAELASSVAPDVEVRVLQPGESHFIRTG
jgi:L-ascorbate metabolism protein UlaG (beta-lactamase superfamily)